MLMLRVILIACLAVVAVAVGEMDEGLDLGGWCGGIGGFGVGLVGR